MKLIQWFTELNGVRNIVCWFKRSKVKNENNEKYYEPIVFMNTPISREQDDIMGIHSSVKTIKKATKQNAKMIGLIAEYGAGKSSLTETLAKDEKLFGKAIRINMWDSISKERKTEEDDNAVNALTKSFVFQLASGISGGIAKHVNRRLSKNHGTVSFSISSKWFWLFLGIAATFYSLSAMLSEASVTIIRKIVVFFFPEATYQTMFLVPDIIKISAPVFLVLGLGALVLGLRNTTVAFSHWKSQGAREPEVNDVFEIYLYLYQKLLSWRYRRLVIIEDLDRVEDRELVCSFLKEIYRFTEGPSQRIKWRKTPVFLISVKPESSLPNSPDVPQKSIYNKIFDYTVCLKPIHYIDYSDIVLSMIGDEGSESRCALQKVLEERDQISGNHLSPAFSWIITGHNLTIRELKDRLNDATALLVSLKNKKYSNQSYVNFSSCAAVTYLEHQYPQIYPKLIEQEDILSTVVRQTYVHRTVEDEGVRNAAISKEVDRLFQTDKSPKKENVESMKADLVKMLLAGDISDDFRMYFYSFPKGSYIKNGDERDLTNLLLLPNDYPADDQLAEKIERIEQGGKEKTLRDLITQISESPHTDKFPVVVLRHPILFYLAYSIDAKKLENCMVSFASWKEGQREVSRELLSLVRLYDSWDLTLLWKNYAARLITVFHSFNIAAKIEVRKGLLSVLGDEIVPFGEFFNGSTVQPLITEEELKYVTDPHVGLALIRVDLIDKDSSCYIADFLNRGALSVKDLEGAKAVYRKITHVTAADVCWKYVISFLALNRIVDVDLFSYALSATLTEDSDKALVGQYVSALSTESLPEDYFGEMDRAVIDSGLSDAVIKIMVENGYFVSVLAFLAKCEDLRRIDFSDTENSIPVVEACESLLKYDESLIPKIRKEILVQFRENNAQANVYDDYGVLFYGSYPLLTDEEICEASDAEIMLKGLNRTLITEDNIQWLVDRVAQKANPAAALKTIELLLSSEYEDDYQNSEFGVKIIGGLDLEKIGFMDLTLEDKEAAVAYFGEYMDLNDAKTAFDFMNRIHTLLPSLEKVVANDQPEWYKSLICEIDAPTDYTLEWISQNTVDFPISSCTLALLAEKGEQQKYLQGKVLSENYFVFPYFGVDNSVVVAEYTTDSPIWDVVKDNGELIEYILVNKAYENFFERDIPDVLHPLYCGKQTADFVKFVLDNVESSDAIFYLENMGEIRDAENSIRISRLLQESEYIVFLEKDHVFEKVKERLWENTPGHTGYKARFTRARKEYFS